MVWAALWFARRERLSTAFRLGLPRSAGKRPGRQFRAPCALLEALFHTVWVHLVWCTPGKWGHG